MLRKEKKNHSLLNGSPLAVDALHGHVHSHLTRMTWGLCKGREGRLRLGVWPEAPEESVMASERGHLHRVRLLFVPYRNLQS